MWSGWEPDSLQIASILGLQTHSRMEPLALRIISAIATHSIGSEGDAIHLVESETPRCWDTESVTRDLIAAEVQ